MCRRLVSWQKNLNVFTSEICILSRFLGWILEQFELDFLGFMVDFLGFLVDFLGSLVGFLGFLIEFLGNF